MAIKQILTYLKEHKKTSFFLLIIILLLGIFIGRKIYLNSQPPEYKVFQVEKRALTKTLEVSGKVKAREVANLHFQAGGKLAWINIREGDRVKKWQAVAGLDKRTLEKQLKQDLIAFEKEYRDFEQTSEDTPLVNQRLKRIYEKAQFDLDNEVLDVEIKNLAIEIATLISPIDGIVTQIATSVPGVNVLATDVISVVNPDTVYFSVEVDESDISYLMPGQQATILLDAYETEEITSEVVSINFDASISSGGGTVFLVKLTLPSNQELKFRLGMTGDANIILHKKDSVLAVPIESIVERNGSSYVEVLDSENQVAKREVTLGLQNDEYAEVLTGLAEFEKVIIPQ